MSDWRLWIRRKLISVFWLLVAEDERERLWAAEEIVRMGASAVPMLTQMLKEGGVREARIIIPLLGRIGGEAGVAGLASGLEHRTVEIRYAAHAAMVEALRPPVDSKWTEILAAFERRETELRPEYTLVADWIGRIGPAWWFASPAALRSVWPGEQPLKIPFRLYVNGTQKQVLFEDVDWEQCPEVLEWVGGIAPFESTDYRHAGVVHSAEGRRVWTIIEAEYGSGVFGEIELPAFFTLAPDRRVWRVRARVQVELPHWGESPDMYPVQWGFWEGSRRIPVPEVARDYVPQERELLLFNVLRRSEGAPVPHVQGVIRLDRRVGERTFDALVCAWAENFDLRRGDVLERHRVVTDYDDTSPQEPQLGSPGVVVNDYRATMATILEIG